MSCCETDIPTITIYDADGTKYQRRASSSSSLEFYAPTILSASETSFRDNKTQFDYLQIQIPLRQQQLAETSREPDSYCNISDVFVYDSQVVDRVSLLDVSVTCNGFIVVGGPVVFTFQRSVDGGNWRDVYRLCSTDSIVPQYFPFTDRYVQYLNPGQKARIEWRICMYAYNLAVSVGYGNCSFYVNSIIRNAESSLS
jgi:hypothetical protein